MKLAISNIAWPREDDEAVATSMRELGVRGLELAPTAVWAEPLTVTEVDARAYRRRWNDQGIELVAFQALLFKQPQLQVFDPSTWPALHERLTGLCRLASWLGARVLVFGSPTNRRRGELEPARALELAAQFFRTAGQRAADHGVAVCIEPNPTQYNCDFVTTSVEGRELVAMVNSAGFGLHLDAAAMTLEHEEPLAAITAAAPWLKHFHLSAPNLEPVRAEAGVAYSSMLAALRELNFSGWTSIEMRATPTARADTHQAMRFITELSAT